MGGVQVTTCDDGDLLTDGAARPGCASSGNREAGAPKYSYGGSLGGTLGPVDLGVTAKRTGSRYIYDNNRPIVTGTVGGPRSRRSAGSPLRLRKTPAYWLVNLDARLNLLGRSRRDLPSAQRLQSVRRVLRGRLRRRLVAVPLQQDLQHHVVPGLPVDDDGPDLGRPAICVDRSAADGVRLAQHRLLGIRPNAGRMRRRPLGGGAVSYFSQSGGWSG